MSMEDELKEKGWKEKYCSGSIRNPSTGDKESLESAYRLISPDASKVYRPNTGVLTHLGPGDSITIDD